MDEYLRDNYKADENYLKKAIEDIEASYPKEVIYHKEGKELPIIVISPDTGSDFVKEAYFLPVLWVVEINSKKDLVL